MQVWPNKLQQCVYKITSASLYCTDKRHRKFRISSLTQVALVYMLVIRFPYERGAWSQGLVHQNWLREAALLIEHSRHWFCKTERSALPGIHQVSTKSDTATVLLFFQWSFWQNYHCCDVTLHVCSVQNFTNVVANMAARKTCVTRLYMWHKQFAHFRVYVSTADCCGMYYDTHK